MPMMIERQEGRTWIQQIQTVGLTYMTVGEVGILEGAIVEVNCTHNDHNHHHNKT